MKDGKLAGTLADDDDRAGKESRLLRIGLLGMEAFTSEPGGLNRYLTDLHRSLTELGVRAPTVVIGPVPDRRPDVVVGGNITDFLPARLARYWLATGRLARCVDVLDAHFALYALLPVLFGPLTEHPLVVHFQGPWTDESGLERGLVGPGRLARRAIERAVYRRADEVVALSQAFRRVLVESYGVLPWRVHVLPPGVDLNAFSPEVRCRARAAMGFESNDQVVLTVRRLTARMGLPILLDAWAKLGPPTGHRLLAIAGEGPMRRELENQAARLGIVDQIRFLGRLDDAGLGLWYAAADLTVVPSLALEGFGLVVLESLASGTPALVSDAGGLPEAVNMLDPSLVVPNGDAIALTNRLKAALAGERPNRSACRRYAENFSWDRAARANLAVYQRAVHGPSDRGIRVVYVDHTARLSGGELALLRLLPALQSHGVEVHVVLAEDGPLTGRLLRAGMSVEVLKMNDAARTLRRDQVRPTAIPFSSVGGSGTYIVRLARRLRQLSPDLLHTNSLKAAVYGGLAARMAGVPCIWHVRDRIAPDYLPVPAVHALRELGRRLPATIIANSSATMATMAPLRCPGHVVASPVQLAATVEREYRGNRPLRIGIVGRIAAWKGQDLFLSAFARAFPNGDEQAVVVGDALFESDQVYAARLASLAEELGIADRLELQGFTDDVAAQLERLDVLVHASVTPEPFGQVVVEGLAAGLPVLAADAGGPAEVITDAVDGLLYPMGDIAALAGGLQRLAGDPQLRERLGRAGRARAAEFSPSHIAPQVIKIYRSVLGAGPVEVLDGSGRS